MLPPGRHTSYSLAGYGAVGCPRAARGCGGCAHAADLGEAIRALLEAVELGAHVLGVGARSRGGDALGVVLVGSVSQ